MAYYAYGQTNATTYGERAYIIVDVFTTATKYTFTIKFGVQAISKAIPAGYKATGQLTGNVTWKTYSKTTTAIAKDGYFQVGSITIERERDRDSDKTFTINWDGLVEVSGSGDEYVVAGVATRTFNIEKLPRYTVSYNGNGGSGVPSNQTKIYGENLTLSSTKPARTGYNFLRWNTNSSGTGTNYNPSGTYSGNATLTLYAIWSKITYTVTYNANGGSGAPSSQTKTYGVTLTLSSTKPARTGYNFLRWNTNSSGTGTNYNSGANYTGNANLALYAVWSKKTYTVSYNANGGSGAPSSQTKTYDVNLTLSSTKPTRTGYNFVRWNTNSNGTGTNYNSGGTYSSNANIILYAVWTIQQYEISYNANDGLGAPSSQTKTYGTDLTLSSTRPTRPDYTFVSWNTKIDGSGTNYSPSGKYSSNKAATLYAIWRYGYVSPIISNLKAYRVNASSGTIDDEGEHAKVDFTWGAGSSPSGSVSISSGTIKYKKTTDSDSNYTTISIPSSSFENKHIIITIGTTGTTIAPTSQYDVVLTLVPTALSGAQRPAISRSTYISTASFIIDINAEGNGVGIGMTAPDNITGNNQFHVNANTYIYKPTYFKNDILFEKDNDTARIQVKTNSANGESVAYGQLVTNEGGSFGLYDTLHSQWLIRSDTNGNSHFSPIAITSLYNTKITAPTEQETYAYSSVISGLANYNMIAVRIEVNNVRQILLFLRVFGNIPQMITDMYGTTYVRGQFIVDWTNNKIGVRWINGTSAIASSIFFQQVYGIM